MEWTREKPTEPGYYWLLKTHVRTSLGEFEDICDIVEVMIDGVDHEVAFFWCGSDAWDWPTKTDGWWYGPLEQPKLPNLLDIIPDETDAVGLADRLEKMSTRGEAPSRAEILRRAAKRLRLVANFEATTQPKEKP